MDINLEHVCDGICVLMTKTILFLLGVGLGMSLTRYILSVFHINDFFTPMMELSPVNAFICGFISAMSGIIFIKIGYKFLELVELNGDM